MASQMSSRGLVLVEKQIVVDDSILRVRYVVINYMRDRICYREGDDGSAGYGALFCSGVLAVDAGRGRGVEAELRAS